MNFQSFDSAADASAAAAKRMASTVQRRLAAQDNASLVVSGGSTPGACLRMLSETPLAWSGVHVFLSDERWVPADSPASNEKMIREQLLRNKATAAHLHPVYRSDETMQERCTFLEQDIRKSPFPFASVLLGMGSDGHIASLFPDSDGLKNALDPDQSTLCIPIVTAASEHRRISLTMAALCRSDEIVLLIFGDEKRATLEAAKSENSQLPVTRLLRQKMAPVSVYWAPEG